MYCMYVCIAILQQTFSQTHNKQYVYVCTSTHVMNYLRALLSQIYGHMYCVCQNLSSSMCMVLLRVNIALSQFV